MDLAALSACEVILLSLADAAACRRVLHDLTLAGLQGRLVMDMSTLLPDEAESLAAIAAKAGADFSCA